MKLNCNSFFEGDFEYLNLNQFYLENKEKMPNTKRPEEIQWCLDNLNKKTFGGYGEDRKDVWKGTYLDETKNYIHLGIDIMAPWGTMIKCPFECYVVDYFTDTDTKIGWGGRIILQSSETKDNVCLVLAHIEPHSMITNKISFKKGDFMGIVGIWPTNGNTFQHLHVQAVRHLDINNFDGYGSIDDLDNNPNPFEIEFN